MIPPYARPSQVVVGPAMDGGYYLLGLSGRVEASLFQVGLLGCMGTVSSSWVELSGCISDPPQGIEWSTGSVLTETLARASAAGLTVAPLHTLPTLRDIDVAEVGEPPPLS